MEVAGSIVAGSITGIAIREKSGERIEIGDLLVCEEDNAYTIMQVYDLKFGSLLSELNRELMAGLKLEGYGQELSFIEPRLRNYVIASVKPVAKVESDRVAIPKTLPRFFSSVRHIRREDLRFLTKPDNPIFLGNVRSGSKVLDVPVYLNGVEVLSHHIIIPATTGRGKSNLVKVMLWSIMDQDGFGALVLDPHDEYYGRHVKGLKDHPSANNKLQYYTSSSPPPGTISLVINIKEIKPYHFEGVVDFTDAQYEAVYAYHSEFREKWIENIMCGERLEKVALSTLTVIRRKFENLLGLRSAEGGLECRNPVFSTSGGLSTVKDISDALEAGMVVIVDTSRLMDQAELLIGAIIVREVFNRYQYYRYKGELDRKPVVSVVIEEAPRVIGGDVLANGDNIYATVAREGRKFNVGLIAITQLTSVIPKAILANMNTKIIMGNEMALERDAIINCAAQDLSDAETTIASLDKGEALISSNFTKFAIPVKIPRFEDIVDADVKPPAKRKLDFIG